MTNPRTKNFKLTTYNYENEKSYILRFEGSKIKMEMYPLTWIVIEIKPRRCRQAVHTQSRNTHLLKVNKGRS